MSSILDSPDVRDFVYPLSRDSYHLLNSKGRKLELIEGVVLIKPTKEPYHCYVRTKLQELLSAILGPGFLLRTEEPLTCSAISEPEPDLAIVEGDLETYKRSHPTSAKLVIEIAISSENRDRAKVATYAAAGVEEYWIVFPEKGSVLIHQDVDPTQEKYLTENTISEGVAQSKSLPQIEVTLSDIL